MQSITLKRILKKAYLFPHRLPLFINTFWVLIASLIFYSKFQCHKKYCKNSEKGTYSSRLSMRVECSGRSARTELEYWKVVIFPPERLPITNHRLCCTWWTQRAKPAPSETSHSGSSLCLRCHLPEAGGWVVALGGTGSPAVKAILVLFWALGAIWCHCRLFLEKSGYETLTLATSTSHALQ